MSHNCTAYLLLIWGHFFCWRDLLKYNNVSSQVLSIYYKPELLQKVRIFFYGLSSLSTDALLFVLRENDSRFWHLAILGGQLCVKLRSILITKFATLRSTSDQCNQHFCTRNSTFFSSLACIECIRCANGYTNTHALYFSENVSSICI